MVDYLNHNGGESIVKNLTGSAQINDQRNSDSDADTNTNSDNSNSSTTKKSNIQGDAGLITVPSELQSTWYGYIEGQSKMDVIKFDAHHMITSDGSNELHKIDPKFFEHHDWVNMPNSYKEATKNWCMAYLSNKIIHGMTWLNIRSWMQGAGDGGYYGVTREKGQQVIVTASSAEVLADTVYWRTPALAEQYKGKKFNNLYYGD